VISVVATSRLRNGGLCDAFFAGDWASAAGADQVRNLVKALFCDNPAVKHRLQQDHA